MFLINVAANKAFKRTNNSWLFVRSSLILANCNLPLNVALAVSWEWAVNSHRMLILSFVLVFPFIFLGLMNLDGNRGLVWFFIHQMYYLPLSWIGEPFFQLDSEVSFFVSYLGRIFTAVCYLLLIIILTKINSRIKSKYS